MFIIKQAIHMYFKFDYIIYFKFYYIIGLICIEVQKQIIRQLVTLNARQRE